MSIGVSEASLSDIAAVTNRNDGYGNDMFGGNGAWWLIVLLLFGWGRGGFGGFGGGYGATGGDCCCTQRSRDDRHRKYGISGWDLHLRDDLHLLVREQMRLYSGT